MKQLPEYLEEIYGYYPEMLEILLEDCKKRFPTWCKPNLIWRDWPEGTSENRIMMHIRVHINYIYPKPNDLILIDSPTFRLHGKVMVMTGKSNGRLKGFLKDDPKTIVHLDARGAKFLPPDQDVPPPLLGVKVNDLVCVRSARFRPRYDEDSLFVVVYKGIKYVRVQPRFPRYKLYNTGAQSKRPGDNIRERDGERSYWRVGVYNMDIPLNEIYYPTQYDQEDLERTKDLSELGF